MQRTPNSGGNATLNKLLELAGSGGSHISTISEIARAIEEDALYPLSKDLQRLANCGAHGSRASNTERDFQRMVRGNKNFKLEPYTIKLTLEET